MLIHPNDTIEDESALNGLKSNCATASRKRKLGSSHEDGSKNEEDAEVQETYENDLKKEMVEDVRNFKLVTNFPSKYYNYL